MLCLENEKPHYVTPAEKRRIIATFDHRYSGGAPVAAPSVPRPSRTRFWCSLYRALANGRDVEDHHLAAVAYREGPFVDEDAQPVDAPAPERRQYVACAFCAM